MIFWAQRPQTKEKEKKAALGGGAQKKASSFGLDGVS